MVDHCKSIPSNRQNVAIAPEHPPFSSMFPANYTSISKGFANQSLQLALAAAPLVLAHHAEATRKALRVASGWNAKEFLEATMTKKFFGAHHFQRKPYLSFASVGE